MYLCILSIFTSLTTNLWLREYLLLIFSSYFVPLCYQKLLDGCFSKSSLHLSPSGFSDLVKCRVWVVGLEESLGLSSSNKLSVMLLLLICCYILSSKTQASPPETPTSTKSFRRQISGSCSFFLSCLYQSRLLCCINKRLQNLSDLEPWSTVMTSNSKFPVSFWTKTHGS